MSSERETGHGQRGVVTEGCARVGPLMALPRVVAELGVDAQSVLAEYGLALSHFDDPETTVGFRTIGRLFARCAKLTGCETLGLRVGQRATMSSLGAVGFFMKSSATVGDALRVLGQHLIVQDRGAIIDLDVDGASATLSYQIVVRDVQAVEQIYIVASLVGNSCMRDMCGPGWRAQEVHLPMARPHDIMAYRQAYETPLRFDAERCAIVFPAKLLARPLGTADVLLNRMMAERIEQIETTACEGLRDRTRRLLGTMIFLSDCSPALLAARLGLTERTMNRRFADEGTSYQQLRAEACATAACQLLKNTSKPAGEIALMLGYSDPSSFTRAFRRWAGVGPAEWRASSPQQSAAQTT